MRVDGSCPRCHTVLSAEVGPSWFDETETQCPHCGARLLFGLNVYVLDITPPDERKEVPAA